MQKFPIVVQKRKGTGPAKRYSIFCLAPMLNGFNEVISVDFEPKSFLNKKPKWNIGKPAGGYVSPEQAALVMQGYAIALALVAGDESKVSSSQQVNRFFDAYDKTKKQRPHGWTAKDKREAKATAKRVYEEQGMHGVCDLFSDKWTRLVQWRTCDGCDNITPHIDKTCQCCGQGYK